MVVLLVLAFGFGGFIVSWAGLLQPDPSASSLPFFRLLHSPHSGNASQTALDNSSSTGYRPQAWAGVVAVSAAAVMGQASCSSLQTAIMGLFGYYLQDYPLLLTKVLTVLSTWSSSTWGL